MKKTVTFIVLACMFAFVTIQSMSSKSSMKMPENLKTESRGTQESTEEQSVLPEQENAEDVVAMPVTEQATETAKESQPALRLQMPTSR